MAGAPPPLRRSRSRPDAVMDRGPATRLHDPSSRAHATRRGRRLSRASPPEPAAARAGARSRSAAAGGLAWTWRRRAGPPPCMSPSTAPMQGRSDSGNGRGSRFSKARRRAGPCGWAEAEPADSDCRSRAYPLPSPALRRLGMQDVELACRLVDRPLAAPALRQHQNLAGAHLPGAAVLVVQREARPETIWQVS